MQRFGALLAHLRAFARSKRANVAIIFALSLVPIMIAAGAGLDLARAMIVRQRLNQALDAAGLAVGSASFTNGLSLAQLQVLAQQYFNANYKADTSFGTPTAIGVSVSNMTATLTSSVAMPTVLVRVGDLIGCTQCDTVNVTGSSQVVWGATKLWVSLVLDNTGSMAQSDSTGETKIAALKTGGHQLLQILQNAAKTPGDVRVAILPFSKDVNLGTANVSAGWIDWTDWEAAPAGSTPSTSIGPGSNCPYSWSTNKFACTSGSANDPNCYNSGGNDCVPKVPSSGLICPSQHDTQASTGLGGHFYNGCYTSTGTNGNCTGSTCVCPTGSTSCNCTGSGSSKHCTWITSPWAHTWVANAHSTWAGCIMDRTQNYDVQDDVPTSASTDFPAENAASCPPATMMGLSYDWTSLGTKIDSMAAQGSTNQTVGLDWGWMAMTQGNPFNPPLLPADTSRYIILLSDGLNTQDRWYGDGSNQSTSVDARMALACTHAKADNITIYTIFVDLNGTQGNSTTLQNCATDSSKYFDLTSSGQIISTLQNIAQDIVHLRVQH